MFDPAAPIVLGTTNPHKVHELTRLAADTGLRFVGLADVGGAGDVAETGDTFAANAALKAAGYAAATGRVVLAEDSGLCVAALDGAPGVRSARFAVDRGRVAEGRPRAEIDEANNAELLAALAGVPEERRAAWYVCSMALATPDGAILATAEGRCHGRILEARRGRGGFGYDPLFLIVEYRRTFGQLGDAVKSLISHRTRAFEVMLGRIRTLRKASA